MRNRVVSLVIILGLSMSLHAGEIGFGVKGGLNISDLYGEDVSSVAYRLGFCGGGFVALDFGQVFAFQPEVLYSMKGGEVANVGGVDVTMVLHYIEVPLIAKLVLPLEGGVLPNVFVGPTFGIALSGLTRAEGFWGVQETSIDDLNPVDVGMAFGVGFDVDIGSGALVLDVRYTLGLGSAIVDQDTRNRVISIMLGYSF